MESVTEEMIHAYVDGQLSDAERTEFELMLLQDSRLSEKVEAYRQQNSLMHELFDSALNEKIPEALFVKPVKKGFRFKRFSLVANIALFFMGGIVGWSLKDTQTEKTDVISSLVRPASMAYVVYTPEVAHPVEVAADQEQHLVKWLSKRLGKNITAPALNDIGFHLVGGRLLPGEEGPAAQFMYEDTLGERLTLYVRSKNTDEQNTGFRYYEQDSTHSFYWIDGDLGYVLSGKLDKAKMLTTATAVYRQFSF